MAGVTVGAGQESASVWIETLDRGELWLAETTLDYAGKTVHAIRIYEFRDGKIAQETDYFGDPFEPAERRTQWVEQGATAKARV